MPMKVEIVPATDENPSFLIINDNETYAVKNVSFKGKGYPTEDDIKKSFSFNIGLLFFIDIFDQPHYYVNYENEVKKQPSVLSPFWLR